MIADLGTITLFLAFLCALYAVATAILGTRKNDSRWINSARNALLIVFPLLLLAAALIISALLRGDFSIAYISQVVTLLPGDLIFTGTPPGVGVARKPPVWLKGGDMVEVEIDGLGVLRNPVVQG